MQNIPRHYNNTVSNVKDAVIPSNHENREARNKGAYRSYLYPQWPGRQSHSNGSHVRSKSADPHEEEKQKEPIINNGFMTQNEYNNESFVSQGRFGISPANKKRAKSNLIDEKRQSSGELRAHKRLKAEQMQIQEQILLDKFLAASGYDIKTIKPKQLEKYKGYINNLLKNGQHVGQNQVVFKQPISSNKSSANPNSSDFGSLVPLKNVLKESYYSSFPKADNFPIGSKVSLNQLNMQSNVTVRDTLGISPKPLNNFSFDNSIDITSGISTNGHISMYKQVLSSSTSEQLSHQEQSLTLSVRQFNDLQDIVSESQLSNLQDLKKLKSTIQSYEDSSLQYQSSQQKTEFSGYKDLKGESHLVGGGQLILPIRHLKKLKVTVKQDESEKISKDHDQIFKNNEGEGSPYIRESTNQSHIYRQYPCSQIIGSSLETPRTPSLPAFTEQVKQELSNHLKYQIVPLRESQINRLKEDHLMLKNKERQNISSQSQESKSFLQQQQRETLINSFSTGKCMDIEKKKSTKQQSQNQEELFDSEQPQSITESNQESMFSEILQAQTLIQNSNHELEESIVVDHAMALDRTKSRDIFVQASTDFNYLQNLQQQRSEFTGGSQTRIAPDNILKIEEQVQGTPEQSQLNQEQTQFISKAAKASKIASFNLESSQNINDTKLVAQQIQHKNVKKDDSLKNLWQYSRLTSPLIHKTQKGRANSQKKLEKQIKLGLYQRSG